MILGLCLSVTFLTEMTSNTATANLLMPLLAAVAAGTGIAPELLMIPAVISASCAFMLPVATAPNAIVYGTGHVSIARMAREGFILNILLAFIIASVCWVLLR
jgi:solute carrier family 13 (sodium-dependent dicarboxylate transporter), member 2/3/5